MSRGALELIGQSGLGYSFDPLIEGQEPHPYSVCAKELIPVTFTMTFPRIYMLPTLVNIGSARFRRFAVEILALFWGNARKLRDIIDVMHHTSVEIFEAKKCALKEEGHDQGYGKDIMNVVRPTTSHTTDTTSNGLSRILHLLALNPDAQTRLRDEISAARAKFGDDIPYDELVGLPFADAVCRETLRLYPPVGMVTRETRKDVVLPLSTPITGLDGRSMHEITVPSNTTVIVSIFGVNRDPALWGPDAGEWKPERWLNPLPRTLVEAHLPGIYSNS
ncbi:hypothetical protein DXG03_000440 [Asterophora parasitica]|uniref:Cytochrome P450 n=1 Tax=Asterophora parasitica TaxID=117018 RepID=A0A9P7GB61_9AGAR|nr:hypothetical protein DXG03_000440 [Asterophora parasitica]